MIGAIIKNIYVRSNVRFLLVVFETSKGIFELDNCCLKEITEVENNYMLYDKDYYNSDNTSAVYVSRIVVTEDMDFVVILNNGKVIIAGRSDNFDNDKYSEKIEVFNLADLSDGYVESAYDYNTWRLG